MHGEGELTSTEAVEGKVRIGFERGRGRRIAEAEGYWAAIGVTHEPGRDGSQTRVEEAHAELWFERVTGVEEHR